MARVSYSMVIDLALLGSTRWLCGNHLFASLSVPGNRREVGVLDPLGEIDDGQNDQDDDQQSNQTVAGGYGHWNPPFLRSQGGCRMITGPPA